jgi:hypothetical protein
MSPHRIRTISRSPVSPFSRTIGAIRTLDQKARQLDLALDLFALDAKEYPLKPAYFDLIVMFYHFDRDICPKVLSTLKTGGILICKSSLSWDAYEGAEPASIRPLAE